MKTGILGGSRLISGEGCSLLGGSTSLSDVSSKGVNKDMGGGVLECPLEVLESSVFGDGIKKGEE